MLCLLKSIVHINYFGFFYMGKLSILSSLFIYPSTYLFMLLQNPGYLFYTLGYNPILHYLFCCSGQSSMAFGSTSGWHQHLFGISSLTCFLDLFFLLNTTSALGSFTYFLTQQQNQPYLQGANVLYFLFYFILFQDVSVGKQDLGERRTYCSWIVIASRPAQPTGIICIYIKLNMNSH